MKNTKVVWGAIAIIVLILVLIFTRPSLKNNNLSNRDPLNISYTVNGEMFSLVNGIAEIDIENSSSKNSLSVFGEPVYADLDKDGDTDAALMLVNNSGGSGMFYYAVLAINNNGVYTATNVMLLGDRIAPQTIEIKDGRAVYNFAERKSTDPMTTPPNIGKSVWVHYDTASNSIGEWVKDFEGEMDDQTMVNAYLRENIKTLAPEEPVLGGSWYVVGVSVNPMNKTGAVIYEDGHIQGVAIFKYIANRSGVSIQDMSAISVNDKYIHPLKWPPVVKVVDAKFVCNVGGNTTQSLGQTSLVKINNNEYCVKTLAQGAAGSTYTEYTYTKSYNDKTRTINFTIQSTQCSNYDEPRKEECLQKQMNYDLLPVVDIFFKDLN